MHEPPGHDCPFCRLQEGVHRHHENVYATPEGAGHAVWDLTQRVAVAMRSAYEHHRST